MRKEFPLEDLSLLRVVREVGRRKSFSKAAESLRMELPNVSKKVSRLERSLGFALFRRSTRSVSLTSEGEDFLRKVDRFFESLAAFEEGWAGDNTIRGKIRVACLPGLAHRLLAPAIASFSKQHPMVSFEVELSDRVVDLIDERIDVAIRVQEPAGQDLVFRKLLPNDVVLCASPQFLRTAGPLRGPEDLKKHPLICLPLHRSLCFRKSKLPLSHYMQHEPVQCISGLFLTELALNSVGVAVRSRWDVEALLKKGKLVEVLPGHPLEEFGSVYVVSAQVHTLNLRSRTFIDALMKHRSSQR